MPGSHSRGPLYIIKADGSFVQYVDENGALTGDIQATAGSITRTELSAPAARKSVRIQSATIATTGNTDASFIADEAGSLVSVDFNGVDVLATSDSNYITWTITNLGQAGAGSAAMLAATAANTTKLTGGTALAANTTRALTVTAVAADLVVASGDLILIRAAATGTLANTVTIPRYTLRFTGTT